MERCGLKQLLFEPELLENLEPDISLASTIMLLKEHDGGGQADVRLQVLQQFRLKEQLLEAAPLHGIPLDNLYQVLVKKASDIPKPPADLGVGRAFSGPS